MESKSFVDAWPNIVLFDCCGYLFLSGGSLQGNDCFLVSRWKDDGQPTMSKQVLRYLWSKL